MPGWALLRNIVEVVLTFSCVIPDPFMSYSCEYRSAVTGLIRTQQFKIHQPLLFHQTHNFLSVEIGLWIPF